MNSMRHVLFALMLFAIAPLFAQNAPAPAPQAASTAPASAAETANTQAAAAAVASGHVKTPETPEFIEHAVDVILEQFDVQNSENGPARFIACAAILLITFVVCKVIVSIVFAFVRKLTAKTETTIDDKLFKAIEGPVTALLLVVGSVAAIKALKLTPSADHMLGYVYTIAFSFVVFWLLLRVFNTILDHLHEKATAKNMGVAAFMPWIKKTLLAIFFVFGVLMIAQSLGANVGAFLTGLGIGGLAFALAAQDTIANLFGSVVVAVDQPFKIGEAVKIGSHDGLVEDIGLRSTKLRTPAKNLIIIPNKMVAAEPIINNSRFIQRRVEQVIGLTYDTTPEKMEAIVEEFRQIIIREKEVKESSVMVFFRDLNASSLDIWVVYETIDPDFQKHMRLRQRINLAIMRAVEARGLAFAFPTQTLQFDGPLMKQLAEAKKPQTPQV